MSHFRALRPQSTEHAPYYAGYIALVPDGDVVETLRRQRDDTRRLLLAIPEERGGHRYAPGKWSIRELLGHVGDTERVMSYRALRIARGDATPLAGFDQDTFVAGANFDRRTIADLAEELEAVRGSTVALVQSFDEQMFERRGTANGVEVSARALVFIIAGHEQHHVDMLRKQYL